MIRNAGLLFHLYDESDKQITTFKMAADAEPCKEVFNDQEFELAITDGLAYCNGKRLFAGTSERQERIEVAEGYYMEVSVELPPLPIRTHPEGKVCGDCKLFSHDHGVEILQEVTHRYQDNLEMCMNKEIVDHVAAQNKCQALKESEAGYCPKTQALCAKSSPACGEHIRKDDA